MGIDRKNTVKKAKKQKPHYVNNKEFSQAVVDYVISVKDAEDSEKEVPTIPNYIGECFLKISEGLSHKSNFIRYTYRDEMVMDAVENCVKAIMNFKVETKTRTGLPNAFSYFTQISYFAFLRRIAKENKQYDIKLKYIESAGIDAFADFGDDSGNAGDTLISRVRNRTDSIKHSDDSFLEDDSYKPPKKKIQRGWGKKTKKKTKGHTDVFEDFLEWNEPEEIENVIVKTITRRSQTTL